MDILAAMKALGAIKHETRFGEPINALASDAMEALTGDRDACCNEAIPTMIGYVSKEEMARTVRDEHDEAMRMQALAIGARLGVTAEVRHQALEAAKWFYREATGREW